MKKFLLTGVAAVALASGAQAADLGAPRGAVAAVVVAPVFNWTGFYLGADLGYWTGSATTVVPGFVPGFPRPNGVTLGGHVGYRHQFANNFVLGAEADLSWLGGKTASGLVAGAGGTAWQLRGNWDGSLRATAGFAVDRALLYVTGGVSVIEARGCAVAAVGTPCLAGSFYGGTRAGWTVGAGLDYAVTQNWTVRGEYLYANYGSRLYAAPAAVGGFVSSRLETHKFRVGLNYVFSTGPSAVVARY
jgi:outer membrane immunogenic protein